MPSPSSYCSSSPLSSSSTFRVGCFQLYSFQVHADAGPETLEVRKVCEQTGYRLDSIPKAHHSPSCAPGCRILAPGPRLLDARSWVKPRGCMSLHLASWMECLDPGSNCGGHVVGMGHIPSKTNPHKPLSICSDVCLPRPLC